MDGESLLHILSFLAGLLFYLAPLFKKLYRQRHASEEEAPEAKGTEQAAAARSAPSRTPAPSRAPTEDVATEQVAVEYVAAEPVAAEQTKVQHASPETSRENPSRLKRDRVKRQTAVETSLARNVPRNMREREKALVARAQLAERRAAEAAHAMRARVRDKAPGVPTSSPRSLQGPLPRGLVIEAAALSAALSPRSPRGSHPHPPPRFGGDRD